MRWENSKLNLKNALPVLSQELTKIYIFYKRSNRKWDLGYRPMWAQNAEQKMNSRLRNIFRKKDSWSFSAWSRSSPPGWIESTGKSAFIWRKRSRAMAVSTRTWGALRRETRRRVATAISRWITQSTHSSSAQNEVWLGRSSVRRRVLSLLLTRWSLSCSSLNGSGCSSSHSSHLWWRRGSLLGVESVTTGRASRNRIGACTRGPASWTDLAVRVVPGRNRFIPPLTGAASRSA